MSIDDVTDIEPRRQYVAAAAQVLFDYPFPIFDEDDLRVDVNGVIRSDYTVAGVGNDTGGTVTFNAGLTGGEIVTVWRDTEIQRTTDFQNNGPFTPTRINDELDRITIVQQELKSAIGRSIRFPVNATETSEGAELSPISSYLGRYLFINTLGELEPAAVLAQTTLTQSLIGNVLFPRTTREQNNAIFPVNLYEQAEFIERQGATPSLVASQLTAINNAILANKQTRSHDGEFLVSAEPTNPLGKPFLGSGGIVKANTQGTGGFQQLNRAVDNGTVLVTGLEYRGRLFARLQNAPAAIKTFAYGDSTIQAGGSGETPPSYIENLLPYMCRSKGLNREMVLTNRGVSGTDISSLNAIPDLASDTDLLIIKYGINDGLLAEATRLSTFATTLRSKLAAIRAATFGSEALLTIVLVGPNSTNDSPQGRDERWYEQLRNVYIRAARDYKCVFIDVYNMFPDSRSAAGIWGDNPFGDGRMIHPDEKGRNWIWGAVIDALFGDSEIGAYKSNHFHNVSGAYETVLASLAPTLYPFGISIRRATIANGWPEEGVVVTHRHIDGPAEQKHFPFAANRTISLTRIANTGGGTWNLWTGQRVALTLQNAWVTFGGGFDTPHAVLSADGLVTVSMIIKNGTTAATTVLAQLPVGMRPAATVGPYICYTSAGTCSVRVESTGNIIVHTTADAAATAVQLPAFRAA